MAWSSGTDLAKKSGPDRDQQSLDDSTVRTPGLRVGEILMTNGDLRNKIDKLWTEFRDGGLTSPLTVIEQLTNLFFCRLLDKAEMKHEKAVQCTGQPSKAHFFAKDQQHLRWKNFRDKTGDELLTLVRDEVFPFMRNLKPPRYVYGANDGAANEMVNNWPGAFMKDAKLLIAKPELLASAIRAIDEIDMQNTEAKGGLYEYLLSKLTTAGINGQFITPDHIRQVMVEMLEPKPTDIIGDPACGTAGFLIEAIKYLRSHYTPKEMLYVEGEKGAHIGDLLTSDMEYLKNHTFRGFDFNLTILRLADMNMRLHGAYGQCIFYQDSMSETFARDYPLEVSNHFDLIFANPPFSGILDIDDIARELTRKVKSTKTDLLFLVRILEMLKVGGRCAVIVPDGVLLGTSKPHITLRQLLLDDNQLDGVISLPAGVFKPYSGVSTAILLLTKGGMTRDVFFFDVQADGRNLDNKRDKIADNDLPMLLERWKNRAPCNDTDRTSQAFFVPADEIRRLNYDLSIKKYQDTVYDPPMEIMKRLEKLEGEIVAGLNELREMLP